MKRMIAVFLLSLVLSGGTVWSSSNVRKESAEAAEKREVHGTALKEARLQAQKAHQQAKTELLRAQKDREAHLGNLDSIKAERILRNKKLDSLRTTRIEENKEILEKVREKQQKKLEQEKKVPAGGKKD